MLQTANVSNQTQPCLQRFFPVSEAILEGARRIREFTVLPFFRLLSLENWLDFISGHSPIGKRWRLKDGVLHGAWY